MSKAIALSQFELNPRRPPDPLCENRGTIEVLILSLRKFLMVQVLAPLLRTPTVRAQR